MVPDCQLYARERDGGGAYIDADAFLSVNRLARHEVLCDEGVLLALGDEDSFVSVRLNHHLGSSLALSLATVLASLGSFALSLSLSLATVLSSLGTASSFATIFATFAASFSFTTYHE